MMIFRHRNNKAEQALDPNDPDTIWENRVFDLMNSIVATFPKDVYDWCHNLDRIYREMDEDDPELAAKYYPVDQRKRWEICQVYFPVKMIVRILMARCGKIPESDVISGLCSSLIRGGNRPTGDTWYDEKNRVAQCMRQCMLWVDKELQKHGVEPLKGFYLRGAEGVAHYPGVFVTSPTMHELLPIAELTDPKEVIVYYWPCQMYAEGPYRTWNPTPLEGIISREAINGYPNITKYLKRR